MTAQETVLKARKIRYRTGKKAKRLQILDGVLARPFHSLENSWDIILRTWVPPPARILDATAGPRWMWARFLEPQLDFEGNENGYELVFGDIAPQAEGVLKMDATDLTGVGHFDALVVDPPYRRNVQGGRYDIEKFRGAQDFDLLGFFHKLNESATRVLDPGDHLIVKIGDARVNGVFEPWDMIATDILTNFELVDRVIRRPFYQRKHAIATKGTATLTHEHFLHYVRMSAPPRVNAKCVLPTTVSAPKSLVGDEVGTPPGGTGTGLQKNLLKDPVRLPTPEAIGKEGL